ncbi:hypothetical protein I204_03531 [Kwoniella mangroviensis CBS 8886]|nr:uncharacterized protein I203_00591 [Kwoniella mangroviensis CBS 8507]OCF70457.1 hypothetical protein I203_00591 [Kwoniella mangroviensis CBS 8507]OCF76232.1 hypothetical protein I204_03531 [Kwoniella mangroviensis CBS 8886]
MAPIAISSIEALPASPLLNLKQNNNAMTDPDQVARNTLAGPLKYTGLLEKYSILKAANCNDLIRDLAVLISRRGVCFFRAQDLNQDEMMQLQKKISTLAGQPRESGMCIHPVSENVGEMGAKTQLISAEMQRKGGGIMRLHDDVSRWATRAFHSVGGA